VGRVVEDGTDEGGADGWVGGGGEGRAVAHNYHLSFFSFSFLVKGDSYPGLCAQRTDEGRGVPFSPASPGFLCHGGYVWRVCISL